MNDVRRGTGAAPPGRSAGPKRPAPLVPAGVARWAWLPLPLLLVAVAAFRLAPVYSVAEPRFLLPILNLSLITAVSLLASFLAWRSYPATGDTAILLLGWATLVYGITSALAGAVVPLGRVNAGVTLHNLGIFLAAAAHLGAAVAAHGGAGESRERPVGLWLSGAVTSGLLTVAVLVTLVAARALPRFVLPGIGFTPLRQAVLAATVLLLAAAGVLLWQLSRTSGSRFASWYALSLGLLATGLVGVGLARAVGTPVGWLGRGGQYLGGLYLLVALLEAVRAEGVFGMSLKSALRDSEERFRALADTISQLAWMAEPDGWITWYNRRWFEFTGTTLETMEGWGWRAVHHPEHVERVTEGFRRSIERGEPWEDTFPLRGADGSYRWFLSRALPIRDGEGSITRWSGTNTDVTDQLRTEEALRELNQTLEERVAARTAQLAASNRELERRSRELARLAGELTLAEQRERQRLAQLLHDHLQQLLVAAKLGLEVASRRAAADDVTAALGRVRGLLDESIGAARSLTAELSPPILRDAGVVPALEWLARWMRERHRLEIELTAPEDLACPREDVRVLIFQSIRELLFNVVKHSGVRAASVRVEETADGRIRSEVRDAGCGFDPTAVAARSQGGGFGLLSISERVGLLGGTVEIDARPGGGTRCALLVPVEGGLDDGDGLQTTQLSGVAGAEASEPNGRLRVLVVDDHAVVRHGLAMLLAEAPELQVVGEAQDGEEALTLARRLLPDVVLMDFSMPRMNGVEATRAITAELPGVRVVGLSMYDEADRAAAMLEAGAESYVSKSDAPEALVARLREYHRARRGG